jgi:hypothetical protein
MSTSVLPNNDRTNLQVFTELYTNFGLAEDIHHICTFQFPGIHNTMMAAVRI